MKKKKNYIYLYIQHWPLTQKAVSGLPFALLPLSKRVVLNHLYGKCNPPRVYFPANLTNFYMRGFARGRVGKQRHKITRKWSIGVRCAGCFIDSSVLFQVHTKVQQIWQEELQTRLQFSFSGIQLFYPIFAGFSEATPFTMKRLRDQSMQAS